MDEKKSLVIVCGAYQQPEHKADYVAIAERGDLELILWPFLNQIKYRVEMDGICQYARAVFVDAVSYGTSQEGDNHSLYWRLAHDPHLIAEYNQRLALHNEPFVSEINPAEIPLNLFRKYVEINVKLQHHALPIHLMFLWMC